MFRSSERSIHEMLKDTPPLRHSSDSINSGTEPKLTRSTTFPTYGPPDVSSTTSAGVLSVGASRVEALRSWTLSTYKCTRQLLYEKLGKTTRTCDTELETEIAMVRDTQRRYLNMLRLSSQLASQQAAVVSTQRALADTFAELSQRAPDLQQEFIYNADTQRSLTRNGDVLVSAIQFFNQSLQTLCCKSMEDTLLTVRQYEAARIEYDAYRAELERCGANPGDALLRDIQVRRSKYERLRDDTHVKVRLLGEHRLKHMRQQLRLLHNAIAAYYSGNNVALEAALKHFGIPHAPTTPPTTTTTQDT